MGEQWYNKSALIKDLTSITGRKMHSNSFNPVFKTPPVLSINEEEDINEMNLRFGIGFDPRDDNIKKDTDTAMFNFIPDMLSMMRDYEETSSCMEQPLENGAQKIVISKLNPNSSEFVPRNSPILDIKNDGETSSPGENKNMLPKSVNIKKKLNAVPKSKCEFNGVPKESRKLNKVPKAKCEYSKRTFNEVPESKRTFNEVPEANAVPNSKSKLNVVHVPTGELIVLEEAKCILTGLPESKCLLTGLPESKCEFNEVPEEHAKFGDSKKKRCVLNVALTNLSKLHQISKEITEKAAETVPESEPLKLLTPDYYMNNKHVETTPEDGEVKEDTTAQNMVKSSIEKVNNWLNVQQEDSFASSTPKVRSKNNSPKPPAGPFEPIIYKKKVATTPNKECTVPSPRITPTIVRTKKFVPSQTSEEYYKSFCDRNERKMLASNNIWDRVEAELRKREERKRMEASHETERNSPDATQTA